LKNQATDQQTCPCGKSSAAGTPLTFATCCARYVDDFENTPAPDAESLMRSRFSAFVFDRNDYLQATWHGSTRPMDVGADANTKWLGLEVRRHVAFGADRAEVEFVARYKLAGRAVRMHELSRFVREAGRWYYVDGDLR
jgi:SEC-C motif domain protein